MDGRPGGLFEPAVRPLDVAAAVSGQLHVDDGGFVRAPAPLVYRRLAELGAWPEWWLGCRVREAPPSPDGAAVWLVELSGRWGRRTRCEVRPHGWRRELGFLLALRGDLVGGAEFWLEPTHGGTVVHHLLDARTVLPRPARVLTDHRRAVRRGLWGLKDALQLESRTSIGLVP